MSTTTDVVVITLHLFSDNAVILEIYRCKFIVMESRRLSKRLHNTENLNLEAVQKECFTEELNFLTNGNKGIPVVQLLKMTFLELVVVTLL